MNGVLLYQTIALLFVAVVLGQSGLDKALHYSGNAHYFQDQFKNSPLAKWSTLLLPVVTVLELGAAVLAMAGLAALWTDNGAFLGLWAMSVAAFNFISLIFGLRVSQDYAGAAGVVPYLVAAMIGLAGFVWG